MGCFSSTPKDAGGNRRRPGNIGEVSVFVPGLRIPKPVDFSLALGDQLSTTLVERLSALRTRIVVMAGQEAPTITRTRRKTATQHGKLQRNHRYIFWNLAMFLLLSSYMDMMHSSYFLQEVQPLLIFCRLSKIICLFFWG